MLSLKDIEFATKELIKIGHDEKEVKIGDLSIVIRTLTPTEEAEVQRYISADKSEEDFTTLEFVDLFRIHSLARAVVEINGLNMRNQEYIETDELLPNGVKVKKSKIDVLAGIFTQFSRFLLGQVFQSFVELNNKAEEEARKLFPEKIIDEEVEIEARNTSELIATVQETASKVDGTPAKMYSVVKNGTKG
jgi:hypothetical protein